MADALTLVDEAARLAPRVATAASSIDTALDWLEAMV